MGDRGFGGTLFAADIAAPQLRVVGPVGRQLRRSDLFADNGEPGVGRCYLPPTTRSGSLRSPRRQRRPAMSVNSTNTSTCGIRTPTTSAVTWSSRSRWVGSYPTVLAGGLH